MIGDYLRLAYSSARHRKIRSWLTMIGIFIGIAAVVALISLSQGLRGAILEQFLSLGSDKLVLQAAGGGFGPPGTATPNPITEKEKDVVDKTSGVKLTFTRLIRLVKLEFDDDEKFTYAVSMPKGQEEQDLVLEATNIELAQGKWVGGGDQLEVVIGNRIAKNMFDSEIGLRDRIVVQGTEFKVVGIIIKNGDPRFDGAVFMPEGAMRTLLDIKDEIDVLAIQVDSVDDIEQTTERLERELRKSRNVEEGKEDFTIETPGNIIATLDNILLVLQAVLVGIAGISIVVGAIGIMNTMYTAVLERTKEIGIMKALGATNQNIFLLFLIESGFLGLFGGAIGVALGVGISKAVELIAAAALGPSILRASFSPALIIASLFFAFLLGALSGALPARNAAKLSPVDALRK